MFFKDSFDDFVLYLGKSRLMRVFQTLGSRESWLNVLEHIHKDAKSRTVNFDVMSNLISNGASSSRNGDSRNMSMNMEIINNFVRYL